MGVSVGGQLVRVFRLQKGCGAEPGDVDLHFLLGQKFQSPDPQVFHPGVVPVLLGTDIGDIFRSSCAAVKPYIAGVAHIPVALRRAVAVVGKAACLAGQLEFVAQPGQPDGILPDGAVEL